METTLRADSQGTEEIGIVSKKLNKIKSSQLGSFKCMYTNLDGIINKDSAFSHYVNKENPQIVMVTETKLLSSDLSSDHFRLQNFNVFRRDRGPDFEEVELLF